MIILPIHIIVALGSMGYGSWLILKPSARGLAINYALIATTLVSGTYLVISLHTNILQSCLGGLAYTAIVTVEAALTRYRLAVNLASRH